MTDTRYWDNLRNVIRTRKGGWQLGKGATSHGYSIIEELMPGCAFASVLILNVTGVLPERRLSKWLEASFIATSWPDPRLWCNYIGALGGSVRATPTASIAAGTGAADSSIYGPGTIPKACKFIMEATTEHASKVPVSDIVERQVKYRGVPVVPGYYRPFAQGDERVAPMHSYATEVLGFDEGPHLTMGNRVHDYLACEYREGMNLAGYIAAFLSDRGMSAKQIQTLYSLCVNSGVHACYAEQAFDREPGSFLPLRCDDVEYTGVAPRAIDR